MKRLSRRLSVVLWLVSIVVTVALAVFQRVTGPTYPVQGAASIGGQRITYRLPRSHVSGSDAPLSIAVADTNIAGEVRWRRYPSYDDWTTQAMVRRDGQLVAIIPRQPPAGKALYEITLVGREEQQTQLTDRPLIMRFRGSVPAAVLLPHVLLMFGSMLLAARAGLEAWARGRKMGSLAAWCTVFLALGGILLGPVVQKYAFGVLWSGWPVGHDLTDNKTAVAFVFWLIALWRAKPTGKGRGWILAAAIVELVTFSIPHSLLGSELDYTRLN